MGKSRCYTALVEIKTAHATQLSVFGFVKK